MNESISYGLPPLGTAGNRIINALTGRPVLLRGVNRPGLEYSEPSQSGFLGSAGLSRPDIEAIVTGWKANVIRLPFNQAWAMRGHGNFSAEGYLQALDQVIAWAAELGAYTLLDLQWLDAETSFGELSDGSVSRLAPLPDPTSIELWATLAERYRDAPAVLFDIFNEPHTPLETDRNPVYFIRGDGAIEACEPRDFGAEEWNRWGHRLATTIRQVHPHALIWISGLDWGFDLRGVGINLPNVVYSAHVYPNRPPIQWQSRFGDPCSGQFNGRADSGTHAPAVHCSSASGAGELRISNGV